MPVQNSWQSGRAAERTASRMRFRLRASLPVEIGPRPRSRKHLKRRPVIIPLARRLPNKRNIWASDAARWNFVVGGACFDYECPETKYKATILSNDSGHRVTNRCGRHPVDYSHKLVWADLYCICRLLLLAGVYDAPGTKIPKTRRRSSSKPLRQARRGRR
jgi:hypothetical protein